MVKSAVKVQRHDHRARRASFALPILQVAHQPRQSAVGEHPPTILTRTYEPGSSSSPASDTKADASAIAFPPSSAPPRF